MSEPIDGEFIEAEEVVEPVEEDLSSESLLTYTQRIRKNLVTDMTKHGMPDDKGERGLLLQALHDMDQTSINRLRLDVDTEANCNNKAAQDIVNKMLEANPYGLGSRPGEENPNHNPTPDLSDLPLIDINAGETEIGIVTETSEDFLKRVEK